jgi:cell division protein FtsW (lipid II flippase)
MRRLDPWLLVSVLAISACAYLAQSSTARALAAPGHANRQLVWLAVGAVVLVLFSFVDYRVLARFLHRAAVGVRACRDHPQRGGTGW